MKLASYAGTPVLVVGFSGQADGAAVSDATAAALRLNTRLCVKQRSGVSHASNTPAHGTCACRRDASRWVAVFRAKSPPLLLPGVAAAAALPLFGACATQAAGSAAAAARAPADAVFFAGGPVWAMDWCPWPGTAEPDVQYLAVLPRSCSVTEPVQRSLI